MSANVFLKFIVRKRLKALYILAFLFLSLSCNEKKPTASLNQDHHDEFNKFIVDYSRKIKFDVINLSNIKTDNSIVLFDKSKDTLICSLNDAQIIIYDDTKEFLMERSLQYWDSVMDVKSQKNNRKIRYEELFSLAPESDNIVKLYSTSFNVYMFIESDNACTGILWYNQGESSAKILATNINKDDLINFFAQIHLQENEFIRTLEVPE